MNNRAIIVSMHGIQKEIDYRTWSISGAINSLYGKDNRIVYPKLTSDKILKCLKAHREIKRLKIIKAELNLILKLRS